MTNWKKSLTQITFAAVFILPVALRAEDHEAPARLHFDREAFETQIHEVVPGDLLPGEQNNISEINKAYNDLESKLGKVSDSDFKKAESDFNKLKEKNYRDLIKSLTGRATPEAQRALKEANFSDVLPTLAQVLGKASQGVTAAELEAALKNIPDLETRAEYQAAVTTLLAALKSKPDLDPNKAANARAKLLGAINTGIELTHELNAGTPTAVGRSTRNGEKSLGKVAHDSAAAPKGRAGSDEKVSGSRISDITKELLQNGTEDDAERYKTLKNAGVDPLRGVLKINDLYKEARAAELDKLAGHKLTAAEREDFFNKLSPEAKAKLHIAAKLGAGKLLAERYKDVLDPKDIETLCPKSTPAPDAKGIVAPVCFSTLLCTAA